MRSVPASFLVQEFFKGGKTVGITNEDAENGTLMMS